MPEKGKKKVCKKKSNHLGQQWTLHNHLLSHTETSFLKATLQLSWADKGAGGGQDDSTTPSRARTGS